MSLPPETRAELDDLISRHLDLSVSVEEAGRLDILLAHDREARQIYYECMAVHAALLWDESAANSKAVAPTRIAMPVYRRSWVQALCAAVVMACTLMFIRNPTAHATTTPPEFKILQDNGDNVLQSIATLVSAHECEWVTGAVPTAVGSQLTSGTVQLIRGQAVIGFACGAQVALSGPASLELGSSRHATLLSGMIAVDTPERAHGFTITTRTAVYTDLGTRFTLDVLPTGANTLGMLIGRVEVHTGSATSARVLTVTAGERIGLDVSGADCSPAQRDLGREGGLIAVLNPAVEMQAAQDRRAEDRGAAPTHPPEYYPDQILADHPIGYWRFDDVLQPGMTEVQDRSSTHQNGHLHGGIRSVAGVPGIGSRAFAFDGSSGYVSIPNRIEYAVQDLSVELWLQSTEPWTHPWWPGDAVLITKDVPGSGNSDWSIIGGACAHSDPSGVVGQGGRVIVGIGVNRSDVLMCTPMALNDGQWHHVLWARRDDGPSLLYVDGALAMSSVGNQGSISNALDIEIGGGTRSAELTTSRSVPMDLVGRPLGDRLFLAGALQEVALYGTALPAERVLAHYRAATRSVMRP